MKDWINTADFRIDEPTVVAIGKFDGEHKGHKKLLGTMRELADREHWKTAVFTFGTPPSDVISGSHIPQISTNEERREKLKGYGVDCIVEYPFDEKTMSMEPEDFVKEILLNRMNMQAIVAGTDCAFGKDRRGNAALLKELGKKYGFETVIIEKEKDERRDISSTYIREELEKGNIEKVNALLGEVYSLEGTVFRGNQIGGAVLGFPTVNIFPPAGKLLPRDGVYATQVEIEGEEPGISFRGITNLGNNPSVEEDRLQHEKRVETFLLDFSGNLYGKRIRVWFYHYLRPEKKFTSMEELKKQISNDLYAVQWNTLDQKDRS